MENMAKTTEDLKAVTAQLRSGKGLAGRLMSDDASARKILANLEKTTKNLESITGKMDRGEGTVGALLNDPQVYEGLRDVVGGIQKSRMGKGLIHHYQKKGSKDASEPPPQTPPETPEDNP